MKCERERETHGVVERVGLDEGIPKQVQVLQTQLPKPPGQSGQPVVRRRQVPQLGESAHVERQTAELVVVQFEVDQLSEPAEVGGEGRQAIVTQVQELQAVLQRGKTEGVAEGLQVVVVQNQVRQAAQIPDSGRQLLDVVVAEVQPTKSYGKNTHKRVVDGYAPLKLCGGAALPFRDSILMSTRASLQ